MCVRVCRALMSLAQIYAEVYGQDHSETLGAARRAQNVGQECGGDEEEEEEEGEGGERRKKSACCRCDSAGHVVHLS